MEMLVKIRSYLQNRENMKKNMQKILQNEAKEVQGNNILADSSEFARIIAENTEVRMAYLDSQFNYRWVNPAYTSGTGYSAEQIIGKNHFLLFPDPALQSIARRIIKTGQSQELIDHPFVFNNKPELGMTYWNISGVPVKDVHNKVIGLAITVMDTTKRKKTESQLERVSREWRITFDSLPVFISIHDSNFRIVRANLALSRALKMTPHDLIGKICYKTLHRAEKPLPSCPFLQTTRTKKATTAEYFEPVLGLHLEVTTAPYFDDENHLLGCVHIARDISKRYQNEEELKRLYNNETEIRSKLESEIKRRIAFVNALFHELKTPLTPILSSSEMLMRVTNEEMPLRLAKNIQDGATLISSRVDELLDQARLESGSLKLNWQNVDVIKVIRSVIIHMQPQARIKTQTLSAHLPGSLSHVIADETRLNNALIALINNAFKYCSTDGKIVVSAREKGDEIIITIKDNGPGISPEMQRNIFEPYYRSNNREYVYNVFGLELNMVKQIIELHKGRIWVTTKPGKGSVFSISLPLKSLEKCEETG